MAIIDMVKYNGGPDVLAWRFPSQELSTWTQLIVNESQEAILFIEGRALDVFRSGRYVLDTDNIPVLRTFMGIPFGGQSPFTAEVWFVNKAYALDIKWGTSSPIQIQDPKYGVFIPVRANGIFGIRIADAKQFLVKLVGTVPVFDKASLVKFFRGMYVARVKDAISTYLIHNQISIMEINAYIDEISDSMRETLKPSLSEFGIELINFNVNDISVPEDDPAVVTLKKALAKRAEMNIIGYNYHQERSFDTLEGAARNEGSSASAIMGAGLGLGMGAGIGHAAAQNMGGVAAVMNSSGNEKECPNCHAKAQAAQKFCSECGTAFPKETAGTSSAETMPCPSCGQQIPTSSKFCPECGQRLILNCPQCGNSVKGTVKFCPECGCNVKTGAPRQ